MGAGLPDQAEDVPPESISASSRSIRFCQQAGVGTSPGTRSRVPIRTLRLDDSSAFGAAN